MNDTTQQEVLVMPQDGETEVIKMDRPTLGRETLPATQSEIASNELMQFVMKAASDPNFDTAKLEKLIELRNNEIERVKEEQFSADFVQMKPKLPIVIRSKYNSQTKSKYAALEDINQVIDPILADYNFGTETEIVEQNAEGVTVCARLRHKNGFARENTIYMPNDKTGIAGTVNKTGPHAIASAVTYAKRVAVCALLNISTGDDKDGNGENATAVLEHEKAVEIDLLLRQSNAKKDQFLALLNAADVRSILAKDYEKAKNILVTKINANKDKK